MAQRKAAAAARPTRDGPLRVVGYVRVSTEEQAGGGLSLQAQREAIEAAAKARGWELVEILEDAGVSAKIKPEKRKGFGRALAMLTAGDADGIVGAKLDRLFRSVVDLAFMVERSVEEGWHVFVLDIDFDPTTTNGEFVATILVGVARWERRIIGDRTRAALAVKRAQGVQLGRPSAIPADVLARMVRERTVEGRSFERIAAQLNADGVPTAQGGARWYGATVRKAIARETAPGQ